MADSYHDLNPIKDGVNWSFLKLGLRKSWHHAYEEYVLGMRAAPTAAMRRGTLIHTLVLEPGEFDSRYIVAPEINRRTKAGKEEWAAFLEQAGDKEVITEDEHDEALACQYQAITHKWFNPILESKTYLKEQFIQGKIDGVLCRAKVDVLHPNLVVDLKTTTDASPEGFRRSIYRYDYHAQLAMYADLAGVGSAYIVALETGGSHQIAIYKLSEKILEEGRLMYREALAGYSQCLDFHEELGPEAFNSYPGTPVII